MVATHEKSLYEVSVRSMETYLTSNFIPPIPKGFASVVVDALDALELGAKPWTMIFCPDMTAMPSEAEVVPGGWRIPALTAVRIAHLEYSLSEQAIQKINEHYEGDEIPEWWEDA